MTRGEIWWCDFGMPLGSAAGYRRPAVVIQADEYTATDLNTVVVVPLTSNLRLADYNPNVLIKAKHSSLNKDSVAIIPLVTALDKIGFVEKISKLPISEINKISDAVIHFIS